MTRDELDDALDAVTAAAIAYRGGLTNEDASTATHTLGTNPWTPIYQQLLADLKATLQAAGHRYDELADTRRIDQGRPIRLAHLPHSSDHLRPDVAGPVWAKEAPNVQLRSHIGTTRQSTTG